MPDLPPIISQVIKYVFVIAEELKRTQSRGRLLLGHGAQSNRLQNTPSTPHIGQYALTVSRIKDTLEEWKLVWVWVRRTHPLVLQIGALGSDAPPSCLQLSSADLKSAQLFPLCSIILCYIICTFKSVVVHHLILTLWKHTHINTYI